METVDVLIVGGGQAGLSTSYFLKQLGIEHLVLEQGDRPAPVWQDERWDSFVLVTPNAAFAVPGLEYKGGDPGGFMPRDEVISLFEGYASENRLPLQLNSRVDCIELADNGRFIVTTADRSYDARNVVIATGFQTKSKKPAKVELSSDVAQLHSSQYRNPQSLPEGAVLVVGSAQSGAQIAEELYQAGREVFLSVGSAGRAPRRYRDKDIFMWLLQIGFFDLTEAQFPVPKERFSPPHVTGKNGGHSLNLHRYAKDGVHLLGHFMKAADGKVWLEPNLHDLLRRTDQFEKNLQQMIDGFIASHGLSNPEEELPQMTDGFAQPILGELDLSRNGISSVIWATGFSSDFQWIKIPAFDDQGFPIQERGVSNQPGLYFAGMPWMPSLKAATVAGVGDSAKHVVDELAKRMAPV